MGHSTDRSDSTALNVTNPSEALIIVDSQDQERGQLSKVECHMGEVVLQSHSPSPH